ncbi:MAG: ABC transporter ATP-binding protein [candidate division Zixibacteria bacterium]|nr:ABC transporter ATP-binding protein [candidate division Zixibacteria bacterium]MDD5427232.1 ABC transporter ATP-binding protein [candidate division Zixibacteria bacterium]
MVTAEKLRKQFNGLVAVDEVSFHISPGEVFGLLGPNGAGKTTIINMLVGVLRPDEGEVTIDGSHDPAQTQVRNRIGNAPQSLALYDRLTAYENLAFFGHLYGLSGNRLKEQIARALDFVGLTDRQKGIVGTFSGGMQRRLNLACALIHDPPLLLLDEPTVGVDPQSRYMIFESIEKLKKRGITIVYTTHYMEEAQRLCDRVAIIDRGKILALDTVDTLIEDFGGRAIIEGEVAEISVNFTWPGSTFEGNRFTLETQKPMEELARLANAGLNFTRLKVEGANLESVFLNLTGRSLRD